MPRTSQLFWSLAFSLAGVASAAAAPSSTQALADLFPHANLSATITVQGKIERIQPWRSATFQWHHQAWKLFLVQGIPYSGGQPENFQASSAWVSAIWYRKTAHGWQPTGKAYNFATVGDYGKAHGKGPFPQTFTGPHGVLLPTQDHYMTQGTQGFSQDLFVFTGNQIRETVLISGLNNVGACGFSGSGCAASHYLGHVTSAEIAPSGKVARITLQYRGVLANRPLPTTTCSFREINPNKWQTIGACMPYRYQQHHD